MAIFSYRKTPTSYVFNIFGREISTLRRRARRALRKLNEGLNPDEMTYYPKRERKSKEEICREVMELHLSKKAKKTLMGTASQYFQFGCDRVGCKVHDFVFRDEYHPVRLKLNGKLAGMYKYKNIISAYLNSRGVKASMALGDLSPDGKTLHLAGKDVDFIEWLKEYQAPVFCKPNDGMQGKSCYKTELTDEGLLLNGELTADLSILGKLIVEPLIVQHEALRKISPLCTNPVRIRTVKSDGDIDMISIYICIGPATSYWSNGETSGVMLGLDENGNSITDAFCEVKGMYGRYEVLPGTDIAVKDIKVPFIKEAVELAKAAHRTTPQFHTLGWDIAITDNGPIVIEGNSSYGSGTYQAISGIGERDIFNKYFLSQLKTSRKRRKARK